MSEEEYEGSTLPAVAEKHIQQAIATEIDGIVQHLPSLVQENIKVALDPASNAAAMNAKLKAIGMLYEVLGFAAGKAMPVSKQNKVFIQMLGLLAPQAQFEAEKRGIPYSSSLSEVLEGNFRVESEEEDEDSEE